MACKSAQLDREIAEALAQRAQNTKRSHATVGSGVTKFVPVGTCVGLPEDFINYIRDDVRAEGVSYRWFAKHADLGEFKGWRLSKDWHVAFYKTQAPSGLPVIYFVHSGIEHVFVPRDRAHEFDAARENALAEATA